MSAAFAWICRHVPSREELEGNRWLRPVSHHVLRPELWRLTRRSVPRGVALGLFVGVMIPLAHFVVAATIAIFIRANIPAAMLATFVGFPVIYIVLVALAARIGAMLLRVDAITAGEPLTEALDTSRIERLLRHCRHVLHWIEGRGPSVALGLFIIATVLAVVGFALSTVLWRWWIARKWRQRAMP